MSILVVGSVALDSVKTPFGKREGVLGGSATYFSIAASFFDRTHLVAVVGDDFPKKYLTIFKNKNVDVEGLNTSKGETFRWKGEYGYDLNVAKTIATRLNVFRDFRPTVPAEFRRSKFIFLANIDPELQLSVLKQTKHPRFVACDTMNYWIEHKRKYLEKLLDRLDLFLLNDAEARQLSGETNLVKAAQLIISIGPKAVIIKKGEHGVLYFSRDSHFIAPAYTLETIYDPTGAGDTFAGGLIGFLSKTGSIGESAIRKGIIYGSVLASFVVEDFSVNRLLELSLDDIESRYRHFRRMTRF